MILLSYYTPNMFGYCCCQYLFGLAITAYVFGNYALKFCFLCHCYLVYMIFGYKDGASPQNLVIVQLCLGLVSIVLSNVFSDGQCLKDNNNGCLISFEPFNGWA